MVTAAHTTNLVRLTAGPVNVAMRLDRVRSVERGQRVRGDTAAFLLPSPHGDTPVFALPALMGASYDLAPRTGQVVITEAAGEAVGIWVEKVTPVARSANAVLVPAPGLDRRFTEAAVLPDGPLPLLDLECLFRDEVSEPSGSPTRPPGGVPAASRLIVLRLFNHTAGGRWIGFGIASHQTREFVYLDAVTPVSGAEGITGWTTWRGKAVPVIDPAGWCGIDAPAVNGTCAAIVEPACQRPIAILAGAGVTSRPVSAPHLLRRECWLNGENRRIAGTLEFDGLTSILPRFAPPST